MVVPTPAQARIRDLEPLDLVIIAPAGCGKTEALALRVAGLISRGVATPPRRVLVTTFTNRAKDNIRDRLQSYLSPQMMRDRVTVANFHGLSTRIFRAHANVIGLDPQMTIPESDWVGNECRRRQLAWKTSGNVQTLLREVKQQPIDDATVEQLLIEGGSMDALDIERQRVAEQRLTYDDLPRLAELILANDAVAELYQCHFDAVVVDEFQDLTPQQLRIVQRIGHHRTTYAGDLAQGIYRFAGAEPDEIDRAIRVECPEVIEFSESHRSSPAVLAMVNALAPLTGGTPLTAANPDSWPGGGLAGCAGFDSVKDEAAWVVEFCRVVLDHAQAQRIGVVARGKPRRRFVDSAVEFSGLPCHRWEDGVLDTDTARIIKALLTQISATGFSAAGDSVQYLREAAGLDAIPEPDTRKHVAEALNWCQDLLDKGVSPAEIGGRVRVGNDAMLLNAAGVHLLTGHAGKGQQFDWIVVAGADEGSIPDFRSAEDPDLLAEEARVLSVMLSRARHGAVLTYSRRVPDTKGVIRSREPSRFLTDILPTITAKGSGDVEAWLRSAPWDDIVTR